jgi:hypothetical protein
MCLTANATLERGVSTDHSPAGTMLAPLVLFIMDIQKLLVRVTMFDGQARACACSDAQGPSRTCKPVAAGRPERR